MRLLALNKNDGITLGIFAPLMLLSSCFLLLFGSVMVGCFSLVLLACIVVRSHLISNLYLKCGMLFSASLLSLIPLRVFLANILTQPYVTVLLISVLSIPFFMLAITKLLKRHNEFLSIYCQMCLAIFSIFTLLFLEWVLWVNIWERNFWRVSIVLILIIIAFIFMKFLLDTVWLRNIIIYNVLILVLLPIFALAYLFFWPPDPSNFLAGLGALFAVMPFVLITICGFLLTINRLLLKHKN